MSRRIRVLYVIDLLTRVGGTEKYLRALLRHIDRSRFDPRIVVLRDDPMPDAEAFGGFGCPVDHLGLTRLVGSRGLASLFRLARRIRERRIDIVQTFFIDANLIGVLAASLGGAGRIVVSRRDLGYWHTSRMLFWMRCVNTFADAFLVNSHAVKRVVVEREHVPEGKIAVIHNGIFDLPPAAEPARGAEAEQRPRTPAVGIVANLRRVKRLDLFLEMAARMRHAARLIIVGTGEARQEVLQAAERLGLRQRLSLVHSVSEVYEHIRGFDVAVLTSESEGLSNALIEYQLCGVPAVAFDVGGNREVIADGRTGLLVPPFDTTQMAEKVDRILSDPALARRLGREAQTVARARFAGERMVAETEAFYGDLLDRGING